MTLEEQRALGTAARNLSNLLLSGGKIDEMNVVLSIREMMTFTLPLFRDGLLPLTPRRIPELPLPPIPRRKPPAP